MAFKTLIFLLQTIIHLKPIQIWARLIFVPKPIAYKIAKLQRMAGVRSLTLDCKVFRFSSSKIYFLQEDQFELFTLNTRNRFSVVGWAWFVPEKSKLFNYQINYFDFLSAKRSSHSYSKELALIENWIANVRYDHPVAWDSYPISIRLVSWISWIWQGNKPTSLVIESIHLQYKLLERRLEYHLLGNHLLMNYLALVYCAIFFKGDERETSLKTAINLLVDEINTQFVNADGGHFERSPMYHNALLWELLGVYRLCRGVRLNEARTLESVLKSMIGPALTWSRNMTFPDGHYAFFNDCAQGCAPQYSEISNHYKRECNHFETKPKGKAVSNLRITEMPDTGFCRVDSEGQTLIFNTGNISPDYQPGHSTACSLAFEWFALGHKIFVNSGVSSYEIDSRRHFERSSKAQNTLTINTRDSSQVWSSFRVGRRARVSNLTKSLDEESIQIGASHDGFSDFHQKILHSRKISVMKDRFSLEDKVSQANGEVAVWFHLHPEVRVSKCDVEPHLLILKVRSGQKIFMRSFGCSYDISSNYWAKSFNVLEAAPMLKFSLKGLVARFEFELECQ